MIGFSYSKIINWFGKFYDNKEKFFSFYITPFKMYNSLNIDKNSKRTIFENNSKLGIFLGYSSDFTWYYILDLSFNYII